MLTPLNWQAKRQVKRWSILEAQIASLVSMNLSTLKQVTSQGQQIFPSLTTWPLMAISNLLMNCANVSKELAAAANNPQ